MRKWASLVHRQLLNACRLHVQLQTDSPLLVRAAVESLAGPEVGPVTTLRDGLDQPFLPGSTLRGALRSRAERIARTLRTDSACNPVEDRGPQRSCSRRLEEREPQRGERTAAPNTPATVYRDSCATCKMFGNTSLAGRIAVSDGYLPVGVQPAMVRRDGVGIDRFSGSASLRSHYEFEAVASGTFSFEVSMSNFELWQLGLLLLSTRDLVDGHVPLGSGKARGLGRVSGRISSVVLSEVRSTQPGSADSTIHGLGSLTTDWRAYGLQQTDSMRVDLPVAPQPDGIWSTTTLSGHDLPMDLLTERVVSYLEQQYRPSPWLTREAEGDRADASRTRHSDS